ncbi:hypothetical protein L596_010734 [Steinernema carpocapsae]|uniref:SCP domain-containing protein n=1 Tax=Steinernema carpocapsae TaxID=34508 RepID=A0A4U5PJC7_STECR|nr:hypothetical protein L596_010734 [Steinernema carpocapsae]
MAIRWDWLILIIILDLHGKALSETTADTPCNMLQFQHNFLHVVTCHGYIRFPMRGHSVASMNAAIDRILEGSRDVNADSSCCQIKMFYHNATSIMFMQYLTSRITGDVAFWLENVKDKGCRFNPFPVKSQWTVLGTSYTRKKFQRLSNEERIKTKAICEPRTWVYSPELQSFTNLYGHFVNAKNQSHYGEQTDKCYPRDYVNNLDPVACNGDHCYYSGITGPSADFVSVIQIYGGHRIISEMTSSGTMARFQKMDT